MAVHEEVRAALGVQPYERHEARRGFATGRKRGRSVARAARWRLRCRARRCSTDGNGRQRYFRVISVGCQK
jgi:hypothetical protein